MIGQRVNNYEISLLEFIIAAAMIGSCSSSPRRAGDCLSGDGLGVEGVAVDSQPIDRGLDAASDTPQLPTLDGPDAADVALETDTGGSCIPDTPCTPPSTTCKLGAIACPAGTCALTGNAPDNTPCGLGLVCTTGVCQPPAFCAGSGPLLDCPCSPNGRTACNSGTRPNKVPLICSAGAWAINGTTCDANSNCDWTSTACAPIVPQCAGQATGFAFCDFSPGITTYRDIRKTCGPDLVNTTTMPCSGVCDANLGCQNPRCGDGKVEGSEECDDGNTMALDGCEPVSAPSGEACVKSKILAVSAGAQHTCALFKGGYARCWGANDANQLGLGHTQFEGNLKPYQLTIFDGRGNPQPAGPIEFGGLAVAAISAGTDFTCALLVDQSVRCWGENNQGQLGLGNATSFTNATPNSLGAIALGGPVKAIGTGSKTACALLVNGDVRCWGMNGGRLGTGDTAVLSTTQTPAQIAATYANWISLGAPATAIGVGAGGSCALLSDNSIRCWGNNSSGQLGIGTSTQLAQTLVPSAYSAVLMPAKTPTSISVGAGFACTRFVDGTAECWGNNAAGQLGVGTTNNVGAFNSPAVNGLVALPAVGVDSIFTGLGLNTCAFFSAAGGLHCWGDNSKGQLGYPDLTNRGDTPQSTPDVPAQSPPINFGGDLSAVSFSMGAAHACAILSNGELRCWGFNNNGQLGRGFISESPTDFVGGTATTTPDNMITSVQLFP